MKKLISELSEQEINYWVAKAEGYPIYDTRNESWPGNGKVNQERFEHPIITISLIGVINIEDNAGGKLFDPCNNPAQAWPIIQNNYITVSCDKHKSTAWDTQKGIIGGVWRDDKNVLIAAMRCRIAMVYGDSVEIDDE